MSNGIACLLSILEPVVHIEKIDGYQIFTHNPKAEDISDAIREVLSTKRTNIKVKLTPIKQDIMREASFEERCKDYFEENFETLAKEAPLILPCKQPEKFKEIVKTMEYWCIKTNKSSSIKGLVLHSFSVVRHLEHFGFTREALKERLKIEDISEASVIVVYNPQENVILLIRTAESQDLETDIKLGLNDLKMFILLFNDKLKDSNMKLISLVVTDKENYHKLQCPDCKNNVLSLETLKDPATFENWWEGKSTHFEKETVENINTDFINSFLAKFTGTVASAFLYGKFIPTMTKKSDEQMENLSVLLTREQIEIVYSQHKHIIIRGGFGCGKTIIAAVMLKQISESLKIDEKLYYICYDSRSELLDQVTQDAEEKGMTNVTPFHNAERRKLSEIIKGILGKNEGTKKINFVVDEYDGEDLDESEAKSLNLIFNISLKQAFIFLIVQPIEKERTIDNINQKRNRFELLENMKLYQLNRVMRNSVEIHNLVKLTTDVLQKQRTIFIHKEDSNMKSESQIFRPVSKILNIFRGNKNVTKAPELGPDITEESLSKQVDPYDYPKENPGIPTLGSDETKAVAAVMKGTSYGGPHKYPEENSSIPKLGLDEAQAVSGSVKRTSGGGVKTISKFLFATADKTGHKISSKKPAFFELGKKSDFEKILSLIAIFEERKIKRGEHVVLHFDTGIKGIPDVFLFLFAHHFNMKEKVTNKYQEFKSLEKPILVCSYASFRGLEHPKITVIIDRDIYYVQHYLVETLARCTSDLYIVVLQNSVTLKEVRTKWKSNRAIRSFEIKISEDVSQREDFELAFTGSANIEMINAKFRSKYYENLREKFSQLTEDKSLESEKELEARKIIQQR